MDKIYVFAVYTHRLSYVQNSELCGDTLGYAVDKDGNVIETHYSSGLGWTYRDMGISSDWKHETYKTKYPNGYELIWLGGFESFDEALKKIN